MTTRFIDLTPITKRASFIPIETMNRHKSNSRANDYLFDNDPVRPNRLTNLSKLNALYRAYIELSPNE